jgi:hypothetical protein
MGWSGRAPAATLAVALPKDERGTEMRDLVELMERHIRHHLGRARAAALNGPTRASTLLAPHIADLGAVLGKVHADKHVDFELSPSVRGSLLGSDAILVQAGSFGADQSGLKQIDIATV